mmetsp:Transcript_27689/g.76617  ORF Transcript_27689/g.76617 Transcript_27689/m.76617 type:complete len:347 (-) Transcript_27689:69-1109(-)
MVPPTLLLPRLTKPHAIQSARVACRRGLALLAAAAFLHHVVRARAAHPLPRHPGLLHAELCAAGPAVRGGEPQRSRARGLRKASTGGHGIDQIAIVRHGTVDKDAQNLPSRCPNVHVPRFVAPSVDPVVVVRGARLGDAANVKDVLEAAGCKSDHRSRPQGLNVQVRVVSQLHGLDRGRGPRDDACGDLHRAGLSRPHLLGQLAGEVRGRKEAAEQSKAHGEEDHNHDTQPPGLLLLVRVHACRRHELRFIDHAVPIKIKDAELLRQSRWECQERVRHALALRALPLFGRLTHLLESHLAIVCRIVKRLQDAPQLRIEFLRKRAEPLRSPARAVGHVLRRASSVAH